MLSDKLRPIYHGFACAIHHGSTTTNRHTPCGSQFRERGRSGGAIVTAMRSLRPNRLPRQPVARAFRLLTLPDVVTLAVEMPKMDGLTFLSKLMTYQPMPVVMVSSLMVRGARTTLMAPELGYSIS